MKKKRQNVETSKRRNKNDNPKRAPHYFDFSTFRLSVIIPARNEARTIGRVLKELQGAGVAEVIVVDGQSSDDTREIARCLGANVIESPPGRGRQLNAGAAVATGDTFLFLHADTLPPSQFAAHIFRILARPGVSAGAFRLSIESSRRSLRLIEKLVDYRSRLLQMPYGDQAIFLRANVFRRVGGFPDHPAMEDYALVRRLHRLGRVEIAPAAVLTSARRWLDDGVLRVTIRNQLYIVAYHLGVSPSRIARWRGMVGRVIDPPVCFRTPVGSMTRPTAIRPPE